MNETTPAPPEPRPTPYAWFVLAMMMLAYMVSFIDRQLLTLLVDPIRASLQISDFQLSLLHGFAFAMFYTVMGVPIGRLVDRQRRMTVIAIGIAVWSIMTALCGAAKTFAHLFLCRIGVGVGEAALSPGAYSILSDIFPPKDLPRALSLYNGAANFGAGGAIMAGGTMVALMPPLTVPLVGPLEPWQAVFVVVGLPGLLLATAILSLKEPARTGVSAFRGGQPRFSEVLRYLVARKGAFGLTIVGFGVSSLTWNGALAWLPTFFIRNHGWTVGEVALRYGGLVMICGTGGAIVGGLIAGRLRQKGLVDANILVGLLSIAGTMPLGICAMLVASDILAWALTAGFFFFASLPYGGASAALQEIAPNQMRGQIAAFYIFSLAFFGMGLGPALVGGFTDMVFGYDNALHYSLAIMIGCSGPVAAMLLWLARSPYCRELESKSF